MLTKIYVDDSKWFDYMLAQSQEQPIAVVKKITPQMAAEILMKNPDNRTPKERHIRTIASDLEKGKWELNGEAIVIASDGTLNDGQHRLHACVLAGVPFDTVVVFGVKRSSRFTVDIGAARTGGDFLAMRNVTNGNLKAALARAILNFENGVYGNNINIGWISKPAVLSCYELNKNEIDEAVQFFSSNEIPSFLKLPFTTAFFLLKKVNPEDSVVFFEKTKTGALLSFGDPILKMREHVFDVVNTRLQAHQKLELILRYWNSWRRGDTLSRRLAIMGNYPKIME